MKITHGGIGYMEYGFAQRLGLPMAVIENKAGQFVMPDAAGGQAALAAAAASMPDDLRLFLPDPDGETSYPIVSLSWVLLYKHYADTDKASALREALTWALRDGQSIAEDMGYIPLPKEITSKAIQTIESVR